MYKMAILSKIKPHFDTVDCFKELPFYNKPIKKSKVKRLKKHWSISWISFLWGTECNKTDQVFKGYAISYKVEIIERKDPTVQSGASKLDIKNFFSDLLNETKGFKYQITVKVLLKKIQAQWRNWICSSLFQFIDKNSTKLQI